MHWGNCERSSIGPTPGEHNSQNAVCRRVEIQLKFPRFAACLLHQRWVKQQTHAIDKRSRHRESPAGGGRAVQLVAQQLFVKLQVSQEFFSLVVRPLQRLP